MKIRYCSRFLNLFKLFVLPLSANALNFCSWKQSFDVTKFKRSSNDSEYSESRVGHDKYTGSWSDVLILYAFVLNLKQYSVCYSVRDISSISVQKLRRTVQVNSINKFPLTRTHKNDYIFNDGRGDLRQQQMDDRSRAMTAATISLAFGLLAGCSAIVFPADHEPGTSTGHTARADHRTPRDMRELKIDAQGLDLLSAGLKTTGQKWSSDEYQTLSSVQQTSDDGSPPVTAKVDVYPALTTDSPPFVARSRYVSNHLHPPYLHHLYGGDTNIQQETVDPEDQRSEYSTAKWNR